MISPERKVDFVVGNTQLNMEALATAIGITPDDQGVWSRRQPTYSWWEISELGTNAHDVSSMIGRVFDRLEPARQSLMSLCNEPESTCLLRITLHITDDERVEVGPGFVISEDQIRFLAEINGHIDADLYGDCYDTEEMSNP